MTKAESSEAKDWQQKLSTNQIVIIDGATGTELQRRGVPMDEVAWSGAAVLGHPDSVRAVHEDYIRAGAQVIIANSFGSTRQMLEPAGYGKHVEAANRCAVELALEARASVGDASIAVAGSIFAMPPGFDREAFLLPEKELDSYREAVTIQAETGVDLIALEMMEDTQHAARAMQAALESKLPVWLGVSCRQTDDGRLIGFGREDTTLAEVLDALIPLGPSLVNIMHTNAHVVPAALELVRERWDGPIGVYPDSGYFTKPNWNFVDVIPPDDLVAEAKSWVQSGVRLLGGCCGTGPQHVKALRRSSFALSNKT